MANVLVDRQVLEDIATSLRNKTGIEDNLKPRELAALIENIPSTEDIKEIRQEGNTLIIPEGLVQLDLEETRFESRSKILKIS